MRRNILFVSAVCILNFCSSALANTKHAPLPDQILQARTAYIDNRSGFAAFGDRAYDELAKWGRFKIVKSAKEADLVFLLSAYEYVTGYRTDTSGTTTGTVDNSGNVRLDGDSTSRTHAQTGGTTYLTLIDPNTGKSLWADQEVWGGGHPVTWMGFTFAKSATRLLVKELRKRIEAQESDSKKVGKLDSAPGANTPEANATVAEQYLAMTQDGGVGLTRAIAWRMANAYPKAWNQISTELVNSTLKEAGIGPDIQALVDAIVEMRAAVAADDGEAIGRAVVKIVGAPKAEEKPERLLVRDLPKKINEQKSDSKESGELDSAVEANTPEGNARFAERYLAMTPDGGIGLMRAIAQRMAKAYPETWNQISTELLSSTLKAAGIGTDSQGLFATIREMRAAIQAKDTEALSRASARL